MKYALYHYIPLIGIYLVDPIGHLLDIERSPDGPVVVHDVNGHLAPPGLAGVHCECERVAGGSAAGRVLIGDLWGKTEMIYIILFYCCSCTLTFSFVPCMYDRRRGTSTACMFFFV